MRFKVKVINPDSIRVRARARVRVRVKVRVKVRVRVSLGLVGGCVRHLVARLRRRISVCMSVRGYRSVVVGEV